MSFRFFFQLFVKAFIVAAFFIVVAVVTLTAYGYKYDHEANKLEPTGIIIVDGAQRDLQVLLDGKEISKSLPTRILGAREGFHALEIRKTGFLPWNMNITVTSGLVTQVPFVLLLEDKPHERFQAVASLVRLFPSPIRLIATTSDAAVVKTDVDYWLLSQNYKKKARLIFPKMLGDPVFLTGELQGYFFSDKHEFRHFFLDRGKVVLGTLESFPYDRATFRFFQFSEDFSSFLFERSGELIGISRQDDSTKLYTRLVKSISRAAWFYDTHHFVIQFNDELQFCDEAFANCYRLADMTYGDTFSVDLRGVYILRAKEGRLEYLPIVTFERTFLSYIFSEQVSL